MVGTMVVGGTVAASIAVMLDELNVNPYKAAANLLADRLQKRYPIIKDVRKVVRKHQDRRVRDDLRMFLNDRNIKFRYLIGTDLYVDKQNLTKVRHALREFFGTWKDKVDSHSCWGEELTAYYADENHPQIRIEVKYDINDLPNGFLKPGCRIERDVETVTIKNCRIVCDN